MPYGEPEPDDPQVLVGVSLEGDGESTREMAAAFADEFARMGFDAGRILALFRSPFYAGAHAALRLLGEAEIDRLVAESVAFWGGARVRVRDAAPASGINAAFRAGPAGPRRAG
jgi:hypothetical protein